MKEINALVRLSYHIFILVFTFKDIIFTHIVYTHIPLARYLRQRMQLCKVNGQVRE
jgi:hypothetical protein